jgi:plasmid stabilization system protein ParE
MTFRVEITRTAAREIEERYDRINEQGRNSADKWRAGLIEALGALGANPEMYPEAPEAEWYGAGLRELYYGKRRNTYRILFEIRENVVYILRVRHGRQDFLKPEEF